MKTSSAPTPRSVLGILALAAALCALAAVDAPKAEAASCAPVNNPYPGTRYEGVDLTQIRTAGVGCSTGRAVARGAHRRALGLTPAGSGIRRFSWHGWRVTGNLRGSMDRYVARRGGRRVSWAF